VAVVGAIAAVVLSLGPQTAVYRFLYERVVFLHGLRALSRLSLLPVLALCVLAGLALARARWYWALVALALALAEATNAPIRYARYDGPLAEARALAGGTGAVLVLPAGEDDTSAMLDQVAHWRPIVNGDSGFVPRPYTRALELLDGGDAEEAARFLRAVGVTETLLRGGGRAAVPAGAAAQVPAKATPVAALVADDGVTLDLGVPRGVERIVFELDDRPWIAAPTVEASADGVRWTALPARASLADATLALYADPRHGRGAIRLPVVVARFLRLDPRLPARGVGFSAAPQ
jgi:hypothetical protein